MSRVPIFKLDMNNAPSTAREVYEGVASSLDVMASLLAEDSRNAFRPASTAEKIVAGMISTLCVQLDRLADQEEA